jgi:tRNA A37 threonylcarbamoyltransferase TsaD
LVERYIDVVDVIGSSPIPRTMKILGIETSCDETAVSLIDVNEKINEVTILGNTVHSQIDLHIPYGGVFPVLAKREHAKNLVPVLEKTLVEAKQIAKESSTLAVEQKEYLKKVFEYEPELFESFCAYIPTIKKPEIDFIAVTVGPGLEPALWVGIVFARALSYIWNIPIVPTNHMEGHILAALIEKKKDNTYTLLDKNISYPALSLLISGGHTQIILVDKIGSYKIAGETRDDAIGECFDKVARTLGLAYPGGPKISKFAEIARNEGIHATDSEIEQAINAGADYVLVVGRIPLIHQDKCLIEPLTLAELKTIPENLRVVWNSRDLSHGGMKKETFEEARNIFKGWLCQASNIKTVADIKGGADAVLVGTHLSEFIQSLK